MPANRPATLIVSLWLPVLLCMGFIFYTSSIPGTDIPPIFPFQDIAYHALLYSILAFLLSRALIKTYPQKKSYQILFLAVVFGTLYGITDEWHQAFVPYRTVSNFDVLIDAIGSLLGGLIYPARKII